MNYAQLDSHLKPCFAYCSIFPQNFQFEEEWLIQLWEAQVVIPRFPNIAEMMAAGSNYFRSFVQLSFFQRVHLGHIREQDRYSMPQKMQELALHVSAGDCYILGSDRPCDYPEKVRHLTVQFDKLANGNNMFDEISNYTSLYTLLIVGGSANYQLRIPKDVLENTLKRLRVLDVSNFGLSELPESIGDLIHLRCLQLRGTKIRRLPESVCHLYHLQTLGLRNCYCLEELPTDIKYLGKLRHIDLHLDNHQPTLLKHMPEGIGSLIGLQTLSRFVISKRRGRHSSVPELSELINLSGELLISNLDLVKDAQEAQQANLASKKFLRKLELSWCENNNKQLDDDQIIENLKPANTIDELTISGYGGMECPRWLCSENYMHDLVTVRLHGFKSCNVLPSLGLLPQLKNLYLTSWDQLNFINSSSYVYGHDASFLSLKKFHLEGMHRLQRWDWDDLCIFAPHVSELTVKNCPQLLQLPRCIQNLRDLEDMEIAGCGQLTLLPHMDGLTSLQRLEISDCNSIRSLPSRGLPRSLQVLSINNCHQLSQSCKNLGSTVPSVWINGNRIY
jgi:leucine-rich repeat protein SHOC2